MSPFVRTVDRSRIATSLQNSAHEYLTRLREFGETEGLPQQWLDALGPGKDDPTFGWMPIGWPPENEADEDAGNPFVSFRLGRKTMEGAEPDQTVVLLASERLSGKFIGSGLGLSMVANLRSTAEGELNAHFIGISASFYGPDTRGLESVDWEEVRTKPAQLLAQLHSEEVKRDIASMLGLTSISVRGARLIWVDGEDEWQVERRGTGRSHSSSGEAISYFFTVVGTPKKAGKVLGRVMLQAHAVGDARLFPIDPPSQATNQGYGKSRPSRSDDELDYYRTTVSGLPYYPRPLVLSSGGHEWLRVVQCPGFVLADHGAPANSPKSVNLPGGTKPPVHSDDFAAVSAFYNVSRIFNRLAAYGLDPFAYFRIGSLPLRLAYRSGMQAGPGKDGRTVNACVQVDGWPFDFVGPTAVGDRPGMEMHLAWADMSRRERKSWNSIDPSPAEPIGIAADDRWIWHEIGHVLLVAAVGELELRFAHSPGDALAAIALDPVSQLSKKGTYWRGMTFPWVFLPRRHDRSVTNGWSWGGTMHSALARVPESTAPRRKAYLSEQILSSSLFRLYRVLGGDTMEETPDDINTRHTASHYCLFLIMQALQLLGTQPAVPLRNDPEQFVDALIDADFGATIFRVASDDGATYYERIGGCAQKVIRWAFEAQGLYAPAGTITNAPGLPPPVDVYIANGRGSESTESEPIEYGPGSYAPVSLHWPLDQNVGDPLPWQAHRNAITVEASGISVVVGNRGSEKATGVTVAVWWREWPINSAPPAWNEPGWTALPATAAQDIEAQADATFGPFQFAPASGQRFIILAKASCLADGAYIDVPARACSYMRTRLIDLVSGDNNMGLRVVTLPLP
ncbi:hypothetical protein [Bradyrhizobium valentinum]|nr:hypothetical protein [Bradyrhizobium valentinum]